MTKAQKTVVSLLAVIAGLLALNVAIIAPGQQAQAQMGPPNEVVDFETDTYGVTIFRVFRDGTVEWNFREFCEPDLWCGWQVVPEEAAAVER